MWWESGKSEEEGRASGAFGLGFRVWGIILQRKTKVQLM